MEFKVKELGLKFSIPDRPTVAQQLAYSGQIFATRDADIFWRNWMAATALITEWECKAIPDYRKVYQSRVEGEEPDAEAVYLDEETNPTVAHALIRVGNEVGLFLAALEDVPKNS